MTLSTFLDPMFRRRAAGLAAVCLAAVLAGCASKPNRAPVEVRQAPARSTPPAPPATGAEPAAEASAAAAALPGAENAGKPGYYSVKPGDTLIRIGLESGQNWRDIARWNAIDNPNLIEVGQVLRVAPPGVDPTLAGARPVSNAGRVETRPLDPRAAAPGAASAPAGPWASPPVVGAAPSGGLVSGPGAGGVPLHGSARSW